MRILYIGVQRGTTLHRAGALKRLGHEVIMIDPFSFLPAAGIAQKIVSKAIYEFGGGIFEPYIRKRLLAELQGVSADLAWVDHGELLGRGTIRALKRAYHFVVNYNVDDPFGPRDGRRFHLYRRAASEYDLLVVVREENVYEAKLAGARNVIRVYRSADEEAHARLAFEDRDYQRWRNDVVFVGTWMPERGPFFERLIKLGVPVKIYGDRWQKAKEWAILRGNWGGPGLSGRDYVSAIQYAKVCLGLLSKGNRDLHTIRSAEIPYIGSVLCAERTSEHLAMYNENEEAVFWSSPEECADKCFWLLRDNEARLEISRRGRERCIRNGMTNEVVLKEILSHIGRLKKS